MRRFDLKAVPGAYLFNGALEDVTRHFGFCAASTAYQVVMGLRLCNFVVRFTIAGLSGHDQSNFREQPERTVHGRTVDGGIERAQPCIDFTQRRMLSAITDRIEDQNALPCDTMPSRTEGIFISDFVMGHRFLPSYDFCSLSNACTLGMTIL